MLQLRLTQKAAKDLKVTTLEVPVAQDNLFNDWFINVFVAKRKKVIIFTHCLTKLSFFSLYSEVGGYKNLPTALKIHLTKYLEKIGYSNLQMQIEALFDGAHKYCKTIDKKVLSHMNDFVHGVKGYIEYANIKGHQLDWEDITRRIQDTPMNSMGFIKPTELFVNCCCKLKH